MKTIYKIILLLTITIHAEHLDLGQIDHKPFLEKYENFSDSFDKAFIGIPQGFLGLEKPYYGTYNQALIDIPNLKEATKKLPTILYMQGSGEFKRGRIIREWIVEEGGYIFFAPNTHTGKNRPTYSSPVPKEFYEKVHAYRQAEISLFISRLKELSFVDNFQMFLVGISEGAFATARYSGDGFIGRIVLSWSCEPSYYSDFAKVGAKEDDPFLNIIGSDDRYFGRNNPWNNSYNNQGHCANALSRFRKAKVVILPNTGHNIVDNPFTKSEILNFIKIFLGLEEI
jgi:hypothetical protein